MGIEYNYNLESLETYIPQITRPKITSLRHPEFDPGSSAPSHWHNIFRLKEINSPHGCFGLQQPVFQRNSEPATDHLQLGGN